MSPPERIALSPELELPPYHALSPAAVAGLVLGILSPLALVGPGLWVLPCLAGVLSLLGLWRTARREGLLGRGVALAGLLLATSMAAAGPAAWYGQRWLLVRETRPFADAWFALLAEGRPEKAFLLTLPPRWRPPLEGEVWQYYRSGPRWQKGLREYVAPAQKGDPPNLVRTLLALGPQATARYYEFAGQTQKQGKPVVYLIYAVTFRRMAGGTEPPENAPGGHLPQIGAEGGQPRPRLPLSAGSAETFFVLLELMRHTEADGRSNWQLLRATGGVRPAELQSP